MAQAVSRRRRTAEARLCAPFSPCGICGGQSGPGQVVLLVIRFPMSLSFHHCSPYSCVTRGMKHRPVGGRSSET
jgi:hypothetical protein